MAKNNNGIVISLQVKKNATKNAWVAVPEPSVALMGLLGLGMLIKRRRA